MNENSVTIQVDEVSKQFGDFVAVDRLSFEVRAGRVFGFLGPNGAGKTTTIRMIVGINSPDEGAITVFGQPVSSELQNRIGYLPEERGLYKKMKIFEQLRYFAALKDVPQKVADARIDEWLERMGLTEWKKKKANDLSKGMQQKIQFIATMLHEPDLLILDEPFAGLDPINVETLLEVISELKAKGKTIIFSTHLMETAEKLCDDILLINHGRKIISGSLRAVKESFARNIVALRLTGGDRILRDTTLVDSIEENADEVVATLAKGTSSQSLLHRLVSAGAEVSKFELVEPSLNDIFIEKVKES